MPWGRGTHHDQLRRDVDGDLLDVFPEVLVGVVEQDQEDDADDGRHYGRYVHRATEEDEIKKPYHSLCEIRSKKLRNSVSDDVNN